MVVRGLTQRNSRSGRRWSQQVAAQYVLQAHGFRTSCTAGRGKSHLLFSGNYSALLCPIQRRLTVEALSPSTCWQPGAWEPSFIPDCHHTDINPALLLLPKRGPTTPHPDAGKTEPSPSVSLVLSACRSHSLLPVLAPSATLPSSTAQAHNFHKSTVAFSSPAMLNWDRRQHIHCWSIAW